MKKETLKIKDFNKEPGLLKDKPDRIKRTNAIACALFKEVPVDSSMKVVDFGCGTGLLSIAVSSKAKSVTGMDTSEKMIEVFNEKIKKDNLKNVKTCHICGFDAEYVPDIDCGLVMSAMTMHHIPFEDIKKYVKKFFDMLIPGGYIAVADLDEEKGNFHSDNDGVFHLGFVRKDFKKIISDCGFENVKDVTATRVFKADKNTGQGNEFSVFLITAKKPAA
ncbi:MAG: class I SAM-dependent methyltransferase [Endomicrobiaceae bacterium]|jgi:2-polyprenyl-3-methyl-5-hydroxy-6-metoxy-1,4-benzoquinol methylase|nr:class I SAM-dependent methyltransferase [Endomicrobiaceae bacterium]MDD4166330.1 class I SAM-dependent methyltransferase [Endomicrobiaceae bacterium]